MSLADPIRFNHPGPMKEGDEVIARWTATRLPDNTRPVTAGEYALHDDGRIWAILPSGARYCWPLYDASEYGPSTTLLPINYMGLIEIKNETPGVGWAGYLVDGEWLELATGK